MWKKDVMKALMIFTLLSVFRLEAYYDGYYPCYYEDPCCYDWTGAYLGINGEGYCWGNLKFQFPPGGGGSDGTNLFASDANGGSFRQSPHGAILGIQFGMNAQWRYLVWGLEGSFNYSWIEKTSVDVFAPTTPSTTTYHTRLHWIAAVTPRLGYALGSWLFYAKGGFASGRFDVNFFSNFITLGSTRSFKQHQDHIGWTLGAGVERGWRNWILGLEYDFYRFSKANYGGQVSPPTPYAFAFTLNPSCLSTIVARLSYRL